MTKEASIHIGFSDELSKMAILGTALAGGGLGALGALATHKMLQKQKQRKKAFTKRLTGTYQPGAGMIAPPRSY